VTRSFKNPDDLGEQDICRKGRVFRLLLHDPPLIELVGALRVLRRPYIQRWLIEFHGFRAPHQARGDMVAASRGLDAKHTFRRVG
jgi:hypothetical protein